MLNSRGTRSPMPGEWRKGEEGECSLSEELFHVGISLATYTILAMMGSKIQRVRCPQSSTTTTRHSWIQRKITKNIKQTKNRKTNKNLQKNKKNTKNSLTFVLRLHTEYTYWIYIIQTAHPIMWGGKPLREGVLNSKDKIRSVLRGHSTIYCTEGANLDVHLARTLFGLWKMV